MEPKVSAIVAMGSKNRAICEGPNLLWVIPADHKRLKEKTMGHTLVMGRKTYESIGKPLRGRANIILTRNADYQPNIPAGFENEKVRVAHSSEEALTIAKEEEVLLNPTDGEIFIFGGGEIYAQMLNVTTKIYATLVESDQDGTAHFPEYEHLFPKQAILGEGDHNGLKYRWVDLER